MDNIVKYAVIRFQITGTEIGEDQIVRPTIETKLSTMSIVFDNLRYSSEEPAVFYYRIVDETEGELLPYAFESAYNAMMFLKGVNEWDVDLICGEEPTEE